MNESFDAAFAPLIVFMFQAFFGLLALAFVVAVVKYIVTRVDANRPKQRGRRALARGVNKAQRAL